MKSPIDFVIRPEGTTDPAALREYAERRLAFALRRFELLTRHVTVRLTDTNGPKGGFDSRCSITLRLVDGRRIDVEAVTAWPFASITGAAKRLNAAVRREVAKAHVSIRRHRRISADVSV